MHKLRKSLLFYSKMKEYYLNNRIFYKKNEFKKDKKTLIFIHGLSGSSSAWIQYGGKFEKHYNVLSFDLRGHGKSFKFKNYEDYSFKKFADDLYSIIKKENINNFVLICHSFAVFIGLEFLKKHQKLINSVVFISPAYKAPANRMSNLVKKLLKLKKLLDIIPLKKDFGSHIDYSKHKNTGDLNIPRMIDDIGNTSLKIYLWGTKQSYSFNAEKLLKKIKIPVLLIHGRKDTIFSYKNSLIMHEAIKDSKLIILEDTDHITVLNKFKEVSKAVDQFLKD